MTSIRGSITAITVVAALFIAAGYIGMHNANSNSPPKSPDHAAATPDGEPLQLYHLLDMTKDEWVAAQKRNEKMAFASTLTHEDIRSGEYDKETVALFWEARERERIAAIAKERHIEALRNGTATHTQIYIDTLRSQGKSENEYGIPLPEKGLEIVSLN